MADLINLGIHTKRSLKDQVTPYKVTLLVLIEEYCKTIGQSSSTDETLNEKEERELLIGMLHLVQGSDMELLDLFSKLKTIVKNSLLERITERLTELNQNGIKVIMDLFQTVSENLFETSQILHRNSVLALFVRRMQLAFDKLSFSQVTNLYTKYKAYFSSWHQDQNIPGELDSGNLTDMSISIMEIAGNLNNSERNADGANVLEPGKYSQRQAEFFIAKQASLLQHNQLEALNPRQLQQKISDLLKSNPELASAHYLSYMNYLRINEYCAAMDSLYHYYDRQRSAGGNGRCFSNGTKPKSEENASNKNIHYAVLNLAALHYRFGHHVEALAAVQEAITIAQESNDHVCLQHALSWLQRLGVQGTDNVVLERLITKATEINLPYLLSLGVQTIAKHLALAKVEPSEVFELLLRSDIINCQHSQSDLMAISYAQKAALWHLYGNMEMCSMNCQLMLFLNTMDQGVFHNGEAECIALCQLARLHAGKGEYDLAFDILDSAKHRFPHNSEHAPIWQLYTQLMSFTRYLHQGDWTKAEKAITNTTSISSLEASYCRCVLLKETGEFSSAISLVQTLISRCNEKAKQHQDEPELYSRLLLLLGELYCATGNPSLAVQPLLSCINLCREHHFSYSVTIAILQLAFVQYNLGMPSQALTLIEGILCTILTNGTLFDCARVHFLWAKCRVAAASNLSKKQRQAVMLQCVPILNDVTAWFKKVQCYSRARLATYYLARLYHELDNHIERNKTAFDLKQLSQQHPINTTLVVNIL